MQDEENEEFFDARENFTENLEYQSVQEKENEKEDAAGKAFGDEASNQDNSDNEFKDYFSDEQNDNVLSDQNDQNEIEEGTDVTSSGYDSEPDKNTDFEQNDEVDQENDSETDQEEIFMEEVDRDIEVATEYKKEGNLAYSLKDYNEAIMFYSKAIQYCPLDEKFNHSRSIFYANKAACYLELNQPEKVIKLCGKCIKFDPRYVKGYLRRAKALEQAGKDEEALEDLKKALEIDSSNTEVRIRAVKLEARVKEKQEKMKAEMFAKMRELGNSVLGNFGMNLDNFKTVQDPNTGGYSISYDPNA